MWLDFVCVGSIQPFYSLPKDIAVVAMGIIESGSIDKVDRGLGTILARIDVYFLSA